MQFSTLRGFLHILMFIALHLPPSNADRLSAAPAPSYLLSSALCAGLLPCLGALLRQGTREPWGRAAAL